MTDLRKIERALDKINWLKEWNSEKQGHSFIQVSSQDKIADWHLYEKRAATTKRGVYVISLDGTFVYVGKASKSVYYRVKCFFTRVRRSFGETNPKTGKVLQSSDSSGDDILEYIENNSPSSTAMLKVEWFDLSDYRYSMVDMVEAELIRELNSKFNKENITKKKKLKLVKKAA
jgi:hypothetical protein